MSGFNESLDENTLHTCCLSFKDAGTVMWRVWWFHQVTSFWIHEDGQQVAVP